jgi:hypothetical protein
MSLTATPYSAPRGSSMTTWWSERCADAGLARETAYTDICGRLNRGEISLWQAVARLRLAYWRIQRDLYDYDEEHAA